MGVSRKRTRTSRDPSDQDQRSQEVLRASRELAAYFKGRRTEREARAAIKIIKAFVKERERVDPASRGPLPGSALEKAVPKDARRHVVSARRRVRSKGSGRRAEAARPKSAGALDDAASRGEPDDSTHDET